MKKGNGVESFLCLLPESMDCCSLIVKDSSLIVFTINNERLTINMLHRQVSWLTLVLPSRPAYGGTVVFEDAHSGFPEELTVAGTAPEFTGRSGITGFPFHPVVYDGNQMRGKDIN